MSHGFRAPFVRSLGIAFILVGLCVLVGVPLAGGAATGKIESAPPIASPGASAPCEGPCPLVFFVDGPGTGRVTSTPDGVDCRADCTGWFLDDGGAILRASPDPGSVLVGWRGCSQVTPDGGCALGSVSGVTVCVQFGLSGSASEQAACPPPRATSPTVPAPVDPGAPDHPPVGTACTISGTARGEVIRGTPEIDVICGGRGNDTIYGGAGHDLILGGRGNDRLYGGPGREHLLGASGDDVLVGGPQDDELVGGVGTDKLLARDRVVDLVDGGPGRDGAQVDAKDVIRGVERRL